MKFKRFDMIQWKPGYENTLGSRKYVLIIGINYTVVMRTVFMPDVLITNSYYNTKKCAKTFLIAVILLIPHEFNLHICYGQYGLNGAWGRGAVVR